MIERRARAILGPDGVIEEDERGCVAVAPRSEDECAVLLAAAHEMGWKTRLCGGGGWVATDAPADLSISTKLLTGVTELSAADMVLTAQSGSTLDDLHARTAREGAWLALDPPGLNRSLGSVLATATSGPLRTGFGPVKSRVLGLTLITADGRVLRVGGRVVKNVAGFDLTSLAIGSFGAFGLITSAHILLNALPAVDVTIKATAPRHNLIEGCHAILAAGLTPASMELSSSAPADPESWALAIRALGSEAAVSAERASVVNAARHLEFEALDGSDANRFWAAGARGPTRFPTAVRLGCQPSEIRRALDLVNAEFNGGSGSSISVSFAAGVIRCSMDASIESLRRLRRSAAGQNWPVILERAPWNVRQAVGHYGEYRTGVGALVRSLRKVFDSRSVLTVPLGDDS